MFVEASHCSLISGTCKGRLGCMMIAAHLMYTQTMISFRGDGEEVRVPRLGLARVSIVRGNGPLCGQPCVDDYIYLHEPVADYLTRFSGIVSTVNDPRMSTVVPILRNLVQCRYTFLRQPIGSSYCFAMQYPSPWALHLHSSTTPVRGIYP